MTFPALAKTWEFIPNFAVNATGTALGTNRTILKFLVDSMTTDTGNWVDTTNAPVVPSGLAVVDYSCDSVTAGVKGDGVNRLASITDYVWANAASPHSWIVLTPYAGAQILFSCENASANGNNMTIVTSAAAGFTGGSTTARPTAADERVVINNSTWSGLSSDGSVKLHLMKSTDGQSWRFFMGNGGLISTCFMFGKAIQFSPASWVNSFTCFALGAAMGNNTLSQTNLFASANFLGTGASAMAMYLAGMAYNNAQTNVSVTSANDLSGEWPFLPQQLVSNTASNRGVHGYLSDVWYGSTTTATGSTSPTTGVQHQFVQFGSLIFPWPQIAAVVT